MDTYLIGQTLVPLTRQPEPGDRILLLLTSEELTQPPAVPGLEHVLHHTPPARDARVCKAEVRRDCLCGTVVTPRYTKSGERIVFGYLLTKDRAVLCDDTEAASSMVKRLAKERCWPEGGVGRFFYDFFSLLMAKDLHHLEELEDQLAQMEDQVLAGKLDNFNAQTAMLRKEILGWNRYYAQLYDVVSEFQENENGFFSDSEQRLFRMLEQRVDRLRNEAQLLREYSLQVQALFQAEIDILQNRIMRILTVVTTVFMPLSLLVGWYGMNFSGMAELTWKYGYPAIIVVSVLVVLFCLWIMKKKKFW
ncbi:MAG: CorA family divalent cation transporter [Lawsonibacter sp.]